MAKKYLIVGGVAGGASTAARLRRLDEKDQIVMFEKGPHVSFSNCCLPYHLSGYIDDSEKLVLMNPMKFAALFNIDARNNQEVISINREAKEITILNHAESKTYTESYDKLILSPGANPIVPPIPGIDKQDIFTVRNVVDIRRIVEAIKTKKPSRISVIGGGFIGVECAENLKEAGYNVTLVEASNQILRQFDYEMVQPLHASLLNHGIELIVGDKVVSFDTGKVNLESGKVIESEIVILAIGVSPDTKLAKDSGLEIGKTGAIKVNTNYMTNDPNIYAVGDAIEVYNPLMQDYFKLALAGPAQKQARAVADHIHGIPVKNTGYIGSSAIKVFDVNGSSTGLNEEMAKSLGLSYDTVYTVSKDGVGIMPSSHDMHFKLVFEVPTGRVLGAQAVGGGTTDKRIDVIATLIKFNGTVEDLKDLELCYAPPFGTAKDVTNISGYVAANILGKTFKQTYVHQIREILEKGGVVLDLREDLELALGVIKGAKNIPYSQLRKRLNEIPKDVPVHIHCRSGQRSYYAALTLQSHGFTNIYNMAGGFIGLCHYEYFNDKTTKREPIVTEYSFS